ncbi:hypothetical protein [Kluyvera georgiana]|uniref:hypothetical protein n=1 Tax=Kluyvera georgiana TaxID=73098 RepID=UPI003F67B0C7
MSGTKEKTTGKQNAKGRAGKVSAQEMAPANALNAAGAELPATLPGHYAAVGTRAIDVSAGVVDESLTEPGIATVADSSGLSMDPVSIPETGDVQVLEVRAVNERGFWRCGRFWPHQPVHVFASDDPDGDNEANVQEGDVVVECFISHETAARLKAEPNLQVKVLNTAAEV